MTKKRKLPQTGGQYERDKKGVPVPKARPPKAVPTGTDQTAPEKE